jgi:hypothetical protein
VVAESWRKVRVGHRRHSQGFADRDVLGKDGLLAGFNRASASLRGGQRTCGGGGV